MYGATPDNQHASVDPLTSLLAGAPGGPEEGEAPTEPAPDEKKRIRFFKDRLQLAKQNQSKHATQWKRWTEVLLGTQTLPEAHTENLQSELKIPWAWQRWNSVSPKIMDPEPRLEFRPIEISDQRISDILKVLTKFQFVQDEFVTKQMPVIEDAGIKGLGVWKVIWHQRESTLQVRRAQTMEERAMGLPIQFQESTVITENRPTVVYVDPFDFFWDPAAANDRDMRYCFHRIYLSKGELLARGKKGIYQNVEKICSGDDEGSGVRLDEDSDEADARRANKIVIYEGWFDDGTRMVMDGDCKHILADGPHPYHHKRIPFVCWSTQPRSLSLVGRSEMESIEEIQLAIWLKDNQRIDAVNYTLNTIIVGDPTIPDLNNLKLHPGKIIKANLGQRLEQWVLDPNAGPAFQESESYLAAMDAMTGYNPAIAGADPSQMDRVSATMSSIVQEEGNIRIAMKKLQFRLAIARVAKMWVQLNHQFLSEFELHRILGDQSIDYVPIPAEEIPMFLDVIPEAMSEAIGRMQERSSLLELLNITGTLHGTQMLDGSFFDIKSLIEKTLKSYEQEPQLSFTFNPPPPQAPPQIPGMQPAPEPTVAEQTGNMGEVMAS